MHNRYWFRQFQAALNALVLQLGLSDSRMEQILQVVFLEALETQSQYLEVVLQAALAALSSLVFQKPLPEMILSAEESHPDTTLSSEASSPQ